MDQRYIGKFTITDRKCPGSLPEVDQNLIRSGPGVGQYSWNCWSSN